MSPSWPKLTGMNSCSLLTLMYLFIKHNVSITLLCAARRSHRLFISWFNSQVNIERAWRDYRSLPHTAFPCAPVLYAGKPSGPILHSSQAALTLVHSTSRFYLYSILTLPEIRASRNSKKGKKTGLYRAGNWLQCVFPQRDASITKLFSERWDPQHLMGGKPCK